MTSTSRFAARRTFAVLVSALALVVLVEPAVSAAPAAPTRVVGRVSCVRVRAALARVPALRDGIKARIAVIEARLAGTPLNEARLRLRLRRLQALLASIDAKVARAHRRCPRAVPKTLTRT